MITKNNTILVFDLDDTLYKEIDFLKSAYKEIAYFLSKETEVSFELILVEMIKYYYEGLNVFKEIINKCNLNDDDGYVFGCLINIYRNHKPQIRLDNKNEHLLLRLKDKVFKVGLITDGRSTQQRNKIQALGLSNYFDDIIISEEFGTEKPSLNNFRFFEDRYGRALNYIYVGDNTKKDFIAPNKLGWYSICLLDDGNNIHKQSFNLEKKRQPIQIITNLLEIEFALSKVKNEL
jgi:putative hydrolase of the HAD superfamily